MPVLKELPTPLRRIKVKLLKDKETNRLYIKFPFQSGRGSMLRNFFALSFLSCLLIAGIVGYRFGMEYASERLMDQVAKQVLSKEDIDTLVKDPQVQQLLEQQLGSQAAMKLRQQSQSESESASSHPTVPTPSANTASILPSNQTNSALTGTSSSSSSSSNTNSQTAYSNLA